MSAHQAAHAVTTMCRVLGISPSGYYAWRRRPLAARAIRDVIVSAEIDAVHRGSRRTYGAPRIHAELAARGIRVGRKRVARLMRARGIQGISRRKSVVTTQRSETGRPAPDLVDRQFTVSGPDRLWVADITYVPTWAGFLYLAIVLDAWSRKIVGWTMATHLRTELVLEALERATAQRRPQDVIGYQTVPIVVGQDAHLAAQLAHVGARQHLGRFGRGDPEGTAERLEAAQRRELPADRPVPAVELGIGCAQRGRELLERRIAPGARAAVERAQRRGHAAAADLDRGQAVHVQIDQRVEQVE